MLSIGLVILVVFVFPARTGGQRSSPSVGRADLADRHVSASCTSAAIRLDKPFANGDGPSPPGSWSTTPIVVIENISRHLEEGMRPVQAAPAGGKRDRLHGRLDQRFTRSGVLFPILLMGGDRGPAVPRIRG